MITIVLDTSVLVAAQADAIVTRNLRHVARGELKFPALRILSPEQCLEVFPCRA